MYCNSNIFSSGRIVNLSSGTGPIFVSKCSEQIQKLLNNSTDFREVEIRVINPYLKIMNADLPDEEKNAALEEMGLTSYEFVGVGYGLSKVKTHSNNRKIKKLFYFLRLP